MKTSKTQQPHFLFILLTLLGILFIMLPGCGGDGGGGSWIAPTSETTAPTVTLTDPANLTTDIAVNKKISATFSEEMDPATITNVNFILTDGVTPVSGTVAYSGVTAVFTPDSDLAYNTNYTSTITTAAEDLAGNALASDYVWTFDTGTAPDTTAPTVTLTDPGNLKTNVAINKKISATFSEAMDPLTITNVNFTLKSGGTPVSGTVTYSGLTAVFTPDSDLAYNTAYTATITTAAEDLAGNALANDYVWTFDTGATPDTTAPTVTLTDPGNLKTNVAINKKISATFSEAMDPLTITNVNFILKSGGTPVSGTVVYSGLTAVFTPASNLAYNTTYMATITTAAKDLAGNALANDYVWTFDTGTAPDTTAPTVTLTDPGNLKTNIAINKKISATFSEAMDSATITNVNFILTDGVTSVSGTVAYSGLTAVFTPTTNLAYNTTYTATITTAAKDLAGNAMASNYVWTFGTGIAPDITAPTVTLTDPGNLKTNVAINKKISATFSEAMDPLTITNVNFTLKDGVTPVSGTVSYAGLVATFTPTSNLAYNTTYTARITTAAEDLAGNAMASDYVWTFDTGTAPDTTAPTVTLTDPANLKTNVAINKKISATFSEAMDPATITNVNFTLKDGVTPVSGTVSYAGLVATFTPTSNLAYNTTYTARITTAAEDLAGNAMASNYVWTFDTGAILDTTAPTVILTDPADSETDVAINKKISATFSEAMDPLTITNVNFTLTDGTTPVLGTVTYVGLVATFKSNSDLAYNTTYMATITTAAEDLAGNALASDYIWSFDTGIAPDTTAPTVTSTDPANLDTGVIISKKIQASFSEAMDPATITNVNFTLKDGLTPVSGTVSYVGLVATFKPNSDLAYNTTYTATITTAAEDLAGNGLASDHIWSFTTVPALAKGPAPVDLGTAGNFVLLTKSGITTTGLTNITGDLGVSPIDSTAITGFGLILDGTNQFSKSALVTGKVYAANYAVPTPANLTTAISDMQTAYADAAGRAIPDFTEHGAGDISGMNLVPGLYKWGTGLLIDPTGVTLTGGPDDVWIFQIANDLTLQNNAIVTLAGGAQAKNIFWQVGTGAHLGTSVQFQGILLASTDITMNTSSTLNGRALAQTNVTLNANAITEP